MTVNLPWWVLALIIIGGLTVGYFISMWYANMRAKKDVTKSNGNGNANGNGNGVTEEVATKSEIDAPLAAVV